MSSLLLLLALLQPAHYLVFEMEGGSVRLLSESQVLMEIHEEAEASAVSVRVRDGEGNVVYSAPVRVEPWLRAEFGTNPDGSGPIDGRWLEQEKVTFAVRVPAGAGRSVELNVNADTRASFALDPSSSRRRLTTNAPGHANRVDLLIMGDGYTAGEESKFHADVERVTGEFFSIEPYSTYRNFVNVTSLFVASRESGADHPKCADGAGDPLEGKKVDTAFDASYCTAGIQRLLTVNNGKVLQAAAAAPGWDMIMVVVNDTTYGGAGGMISVFSTNKQAVGIAQHEYGHSFTGLADEYTTPYPSYPSCSDITGPPCEPNVTDSPVRAAVKWLPWIAQSTPVPTPSSMLGTIGLFQGARYSPTGYYRPRHNCLMNALGEPFCAVCRQAYVLRLYREQNISLLEPGTMFPAEPSIAAFVNQQLTFSASLLQPAGGAAAQVQWLVDGVVHQAGGASFNWIPARAGAHTIELRATDPTPFVHEAMSGGSTTRTHSWTVTVTGSAPPKRRSARH